MPTNNNNKDKKSTDTKPKGEVRNINPTPNGYLIIPKKRKTKNSHLLFLKHAKHIFK